MENKRPYLFPFFICLGLFFFRVLLLFMFFIMINNLDNGSENSRLFKRSFFSFWTFFWPVLILLETVVYWRIRRHIMYPSWVYLHVWSNLVAFFLLPMIYILFVLFSRQLSSADAYQDSLSSFSRIRPIVFWMSVGVGHLFFTLTIIKTFSENKITTNEAAGLLDEFIGKH
jgi:hypothetical protein